MKHIYEIWIKYREVIVYLVFGVLTTAVNYMIYLPCYNLLHLSSAVSNALAWVVAVAFAFLTNKPFVFRSHDWRAKVVISELTKFVGARLGSGAMETLILLLSVDFMQMNGNVWKLLTSVLVVILNYLFSKFIVFKK